jgi:hypothetical protein
LSLYGSKRKSAKLRFDPILKQRQILLSGVLETQDDSLHCLSKSDLDKAPEPTEIRILPEESKQAEAGGAMAIHLSTIVPSCYELSSIVWEPEPTAADAKYLTVSKRIWLTHKPATRVITSILLPAPGETQTIHDDNFYFLRTDLRLIWSEHAKRRVRSFWTLTLGSKKPRRTGDV